MNYYRKLPSEHLQYFVLNPLKNYLFRCLSLGHIARPGVKGLKGASLKYVSSTLHDDFLNCNSIVNHAQLQRSIIEIFQIIIFFFIFSNPYLSNLFSVRGEWLFAIIVLLLFGSSIFCMCLCCRRVYEADTREPYPLFYDGQRELYPIHDQRRLGHERGFRPFR